MSMKTEETDRDRELGLHSGDGPWQFYPAEDPVAGLPWVLLIGDSIMNGYRHAVGKALAKSANIDCWLTPVHLNSPHLHEDLTTVLRQGPYDIIHVNIGLHGWEEGAIPAGQYEPLLRAYFDVIRCEAPAAHVIWCSTTQITAKDNPCRLDPHNTTIAERNGIAARVMSELNIPINDLYGLMSDKLVLAYGDRFHWTDEGKRVQAAQVTRVLDDALDALS